MLRRTYTRGDDVGTSSLLIDAQTTAKPAENPATDRYRFSVESISVNASIKNISARLIDAHAAKLIDA